LPSMIIATWRGIMDVAGMVKVELLILDLI